MVVIRSYPGLSQRELLSVFIQYMSLEIKLLSYFIFNIKEAPLGDIPYLKKMVGQEKSLAWSCGNVQR